MKNKRLKVAMFVDTWFPMIDGVAMVVDNYAKRLQEFADVTVFCPMIDKSYKEDKSYKVIQCRSVKPFFLDYAAPCPKYDKAFMRYLKKQDFDVVHINSPFAVGKVGVAYAKRRGIPVVATLHSQYKQDIKKMFRLNGLTNALLGRLIKVFNACDECWTVNEGIRKLYIEEYGLKTKTKIRSNASDFVPFEDKGEARSFLQKAYKINDEKILLFVGRINFIKNIPFIIDALAVLKENGYPFKMIFVGKGSDIVPLQKMIEEKGLQENVILAGEVCERALLEKIYRGSDLFLFPSLYDTNSLVQIEAASQALPTLFIREAKTASTCTENLNAFMSDNDPQQYAQRIIEIFEDSALYDEVSKNAQKQLYIKWDDCIEELLEDYHRVIEEKKQEK